MVHTGQHQVRNEYVPASQIGRRRLRNVNPIPKYLGQYAASALQESTIATNLPTLDDSKLTLNELFKDIYVQCSCPPVGPASQPGAA